MRPDIPLRAGGALLVAASAAVLAVPATAMAGTAPVHPAGISPRGHTAPAPAQAESSGAVMLSVHAVVTARGQEAAADHLLHLDHLWHEDHMLHEAHLEALRQEQQAAAAQAAYAARHRAPAVQPAVVQAAPVQAVPVQQDAQVSTSGDSGFQACVINAESGGDATIVNPATDAGGLYQFLPSTWAALGFASEYPGGAQTAPVSVQNQAFEEEYAQNGTSPWGPYDGC